MCPSHLLPPPSLWPTCRGPLFHPHILNPLMQGAGGHTSITTRGRHSTDRNMKPQADVTHYESHDVEVGEGDAQRPGQMEEGEQSEGQPLADDPRRTGCSPARQSHCHIERPAPSRAPTALARHHLPPTACRWALGLCPGPWAGLRAEGTAASPQLAPCMGF